MRTVEQLENFTSPLPVEAFDETRAKIHFAVPELDLGEADLRLYSVADRVGEEWSWVTSFNEPNTKIMGPVSPIQGHDDVERGIQSSALEMLNNNDQVNDAISRHFRWWDVEPNAMKEDAETRLKEVITVTDGTRELDILNCSEAVLTEQEEQELTDAIQEVANFTGSKIFDRVRGVVLRQKDRFGEDDAGAYWMAANIVSINLEAIRAVNNELSDRYKPFFTNSENPPSRLAIILAHELGHSMDLNLFNDHVEVDEDGRPLLRSGASVFDGKFGWELDPNGDNVWVNNSGLETECHEEVPTDYAARTNPNEDFAETFAIMALGGDMTKLTQRQKIVSDTIQSAVAPSAYGPFQITSKRQTKLKSKVPENIYVMTYAKAA